IVLSFVWFFVTPESEDFKYYNLFRQEESTCNESTLKYIKKTYDNKPISIFDVEGSLTNLLPSNFTNYNEEFIYQKDARVSHFISSKKIDLIYITPTLLSLKKVKKDSIFHDLLNEPEKYGFFKQKTGNFTPYLLVKKDK
ncbi:hypothetical protein, partial [Stenotrophomonas maltophilia]|uniref:hypothetical protein n=1 Tax=Stenotrophomonas maltophilia TaxID=40324 RepID=UPI003BF866B9